MYSKYFLFIFFIFLVTNLIGQVTATGHISAEIIDDVVTVNKNLDMNFGIVKTNNNGSVVELSATNTNESMNSANFIITGQPGYIYSVTLPTTLSVIGETSSMIIDSFSSSSSIINENGISTLDIGAKLYVNPNQAIEKYNSNGLVVMINYN